MFLLTKNRYFVVIAFKMLKMEFKFNYTILIINNESVNHFGQFISVKVKNNLRKSEAQFREKLRKLRLRQNDGFLIKNVRSCIHYVLAAPQTMRYNVLSDTQCSYFLNFFRHSLIFLIISAGLANLMHLHIFWCYKP